MAPDEARSPADVARAEAARQLVALAFGLAGAVLLILLQKQFMGGTLFDAIQTEMDAADPSGAARRRMENALNRERKYRRLATTSWRVGPWKLAYWAHWRANKARREYERELP